MKILEMLRRWQRAVMCSLGVFVRDTGHGLLEVSHNTLALLGLFVAAAAIFAAGRDDLRQQAEGVMLEWLQTRHEARALNAGDVLAGIADNDAVQRATAVDPSRLTREQASVANWIARRYKVAPEPVGALVQEAWSIGRRAGIEPTLILAIMAVESSFNPFAQSAVGAQGLMQVMTRVHDDKFVAFGGTHAAFDPLSNLRVGVQVLKECITRTGNLHDGLRRYVGAAALDDDNGYAGRVLAEQARLRDVALGRNVPVAVTAPQTTTGREAPIGLPAERTDAPSSPLPIDHEKIAALR
jgi:hypothetical protein